MLTISMPSDRIDLIYYICLAFLFVAGISGIILWMIKFQQAARLHLEQWRERQPVSDDDFLADCHLRVGPNERAAALAVRCALAELRAVPAGTIRADDLFSDHFWDSLDWIEVVVAIEAATDVRR